jgi:TonB family protein
MPRSSLSRLRTARNVVATLFAFGCASGGPAVDDEVAPTAGYVRDASACPVTTARPLGVANGPAPIPTVVRCVLPLYPDALRQKGIEGVVVVSVTVDSAGVPNVNSLKVVRATAAEFANAARQSVRYLRFAPGGPGEKRPVIVEMPYTFGFPPIGRPTR